MMKCNLFVVRIICSAFSLVMLLLICGCSDDETPTLSDEKQNQYLGQ